MTWPNRNPETGIRYGVIACQSLDPDVVEDLFYGYGAEDLSYKEARAELEEVLKAEGTELVDEGELDIDDLSDWVDRELEIRWERIQIDEPTIRGTYKGVEYLISWLGGAPLVWVQKSPVTNEFALCSPCVPGACDLDSPQPGGCVGYDVPADWRRKE